MEKTTTTVQQTLEEKILAIASEIKLGKDGEGYGFDYIRPDSIKNALRPLLIKYKVFTHFDEVSRYSAPGEDTTTTYCLTVYDIEDKTKQIQYRMTTLPAKVSGASAIQNKGAERTYCDRYLHMTAFLIVDNNDDPDNKKNAVREEQKPVKKAAKQESEPIYICSDCGKQIAPTQSATAQEVAQKTTNKFGRPLCAPCSREVLNAEKNNGGDK